MSRNVVGVVVVGSHDGFFHWTCVKRERAVLLNFGLAAELFHPELAEQLENGVVGERVIHGATNHAISRVMGHDQQSGPERTRGRYHVCGYGLELAVRLFARKKRAPDLLHRDPKRRIDVSIGSECRLVEALARSRNRQHGIENWLQ
jgi:hypothetical protein